MIFLLGDSHICRKMQLGLDEREIAFSYGVEGTLDALYHNQWHAVTFTEHWNRNT
jgi:hypothetical protein